MALPVVFRGLWIRKGNVLVLLSWMSGMNPCKGFGSNVTHGERNTGRSGHEQRILPDQYQTRASTGCPVSLANGWGSGDTQCGSCVSSIRTKGKHVTAITAGL
jgi:hypothetical protein